MRTWKSFDRSMARRFAMWQGRMVGSRLTFARVKANGICRVAPAIAGALFVRCFTPS
jgi:hypothetical protein